jgi:glucose/arabinose dehydrogenase
MRAMIRVGAAVAGVTALAVAAWWLRPADACDPRLVVPDGFCAMVYADNVGPARHLAVAANGDVYVATWREGERAGGILALRDTNGDGHADLRERFANEGGSGVAIRGNELFFATWAEVYRYRLSPPSLVPTTPPETVVTGMPLLEHGARSIAIDDSGHLFVNIGAPSNACERDYPRRDFVGAYPCAELETSGGIWRFDASGRGQRPAAANRYATGLRHTVALGVNPIDSRLYGAPHGIDHLDRWWPASGYTARDAANVPSETLFRIDSGGDYGFPYCLHDPRAGRMVVSPAYAGVSLADRCAASPLPIATFAAHSAPMAVAWYRADAFPPQYRDGLFVALHGSLFHAPDKPRGYAVMFVDPRTSTVREFARARSMGAVRPSGLAVSPDGTLLVADDHGRRVWTIRYSKR